MLSGGLVNGLILISWEYFSYLGWSMGRNMWKCGLNPELSWWRKPLAVANIGGYLDQVKEINLGKVVTVFRRDMALTFGGWTVAMGRKALYWKMPVLQVCTNVSSAKAALERALWRSVFPENTGGAFQHFGLFHAYSHERFGLFFATFKSHCFSSDFGKPAIAVLQPLPVRQHSSILGFPTPGAGMSCCLPLNAVLSPSLQPGLPQRAQHNV